MGENTKELRSRMKSVDSTLHLTNAMGLVASSKLRRASDANNACVAYTEACRRAAAGLAASGDCQRSLWVAGNGSEQKKLIVIAGDRGLAGGYNANIFRLTAETGVQDIVAIGRRACERFGQPLRSSEHFSNQDALELAQTLCQQYRAGAFGALGIVFTRYHSMLSQTAELSWILPMSPETGGSHENLSFEPADATEVLDRAVPLYVAGLLMGAVRESFACEVSARRMAMDSASKNAKQMISSLQLAYNRARQSAITQEITEIVAGSGT